MDSPSRKGPTKENPRPQEPPVVRIDPKCLHSALKEFAEPLRTNDSRTDFFAVYRRESEEFDRDYAKKYDEDLNTSLIFAGLFSAVSSAFIIDVQSKLEPDPNEMTAAYMRILIHTMNNSLFPDADPSSVTWTGPPPEIVTVQSLLYASLTTSLFAAFLAMLGKQWVNLYLRNHGGSAADKSRDRQRKLDGFEKWHFRLAIESLPLMLQFALLLLGCALSRYLWTISRTVSGVVAAVTLFGVTSYVLFTLAATFYSSCPYQTPPSSLARALIDYLERGNGDFAGSLRSLAASFPSAKDLRRVLKCLCAGVRRVQESSGCILGVVEETGDIPLAIAPSPSFPRIFEDVSVDWEVCRAEARCIYWVLSSSTDVDVIYSTLRFAADTIWYPEIAGVLSPHILADQFFGCMLDGQVVPGKSEYASSIGMALASALSTQLTIEPENLTLRELCGRVYNRIRSAPEFEPMFMLVVSTLKYVADSAEGPVIHFWGVPNNLSATQKLWLSRIALQTIWRWRHTHELAVIRPDAMKLFCDGSTTDDQTPTTTTTKTNCFLAMAICLGLRIDIRDLYAPNDNDALGTAALLFHEQLRRSIGEGEVESDVLTTFLSALGGLDSFQPGPNIEYGFSWITDLLNSGYTDHERYSMASEVIKPLGEHIDKSFWWQLHPSWVSSLVTFLSLGEHHSTISKSPMSKTRPEFLALQILSSAEGDFDFSATILPVLTWALIPTHPLKLRRLTLAVFARSMVGWSPSLMENVPNKDLDKLLQAVGDPFRFPDLPLEDGRPAVTVHYEPMGVAVILIWFASSDLWRNHLRRSNFASCEEILSTEGGRRAALRHMFDATIRLQPELLCAAINRLEELQCPNAAEVVILWAWTVGVVNVMDHDAWGSIERKTLDFYRTHGIIRLTTLSRHLADTFYNMELLMEYQVSPFWVRGVEPWVRGLQPLRVFCVAKACQLRRLYQLFGHDHITWKEVAVGEADEKLFLGRPVTPAQFTDWACDYP